MESVRRKILILGALAALGTAASVGMLTLSARGPASFPDRQSLAEMQGAVSWVRPDRYGVQFGLEGGTRTFIYSKKSGEFSKVTAALSDAGQQPIVVLTREASRPDVGPVLQVLAIKTRTGSLRALEDVKASWSEDYRYGYVAGIMLLLASGFLAYRAHKLRNQQPAIDLKLKGN